MALAEAVDRPKSKLSPWPVRNSEAVEFRSKAAGDTMAVGVWSDSRQRPLRTVGKAAPLDIVYVLDGSFMLATAATACTLLAADRVNPGFPSLLLVGVDYPEDRPNARTRD